MSNARSAAELERRHPVDFQQKLNEIVEYAVKIGVSTPK